MALCILWITVTICFVLNCMPLLCKAGIHHLAFKNDSRSVIVIEAFGFTERGQFEMNVSKASWVMDDDNDNDAPEVIDLSLIGFFLITEQGSVQLVSQDDEENEESRSICLLKSKYVKPLFTFNELSTGSNGFNQYNHTFSSPAQSLYVLMFANCLPHTQVSMVLRTSMYNLEGANNGSKNFLSDGETQLPIIFFCFFVLYLLLGSIWIYVCMKHRKSTHLIHILMGVLLLSKALYMFSEAEDKAYIERTGSPHGWDIAFYAFNLIRGVMLFTVIVLIGTGWSFLKPYLQQRDKKILMLVIPLQVLENIATVVIGETGPFWKEWLAWIQILLLIDIVCCAAVLFPIVWSIRNLQDEAQTDDKAARNLVKLTLFRQYYIVVISYIYYTRVIVFVLAVTGSYRQRWMGELNREIATLAFYIFTVYKFRPAPHNPYFVLDDDEEEDEEPEAFKAEQFEL